jgi:hypothetical protein
MAKNSGKDWITDLQCGKIEAILSKCRITSLTVNFKATVIMVSSYGHWLEYFGRSVQRAL